jgi:GNAT superfamily N-acetyltransferase
MKIDLLTPAEAPHYRALTFPRYRGWLDGDTLEAEVMGLTVAHEGQPAGLALARLSSDNRAARLASLVVVPEARGQGWGRALLAGLENALQARGCEAISVQYACGPTTPAFERILQQGDWTPPELVQFVLKGDRTAPARLRWFRRSLPAGFEVFPWVALSAAERQALQAEQAAHPWYPEVLSPFLEEARCEPHTSLGLRVQGQVVGWAMFHTLTPDTLRFTSLFIRPEAQGSGAGMALVAECLRRVLTHTTFQFVTFIIHAQNAQMLRFARRHIMAEMCSVVEQRQAAKKLIQVQKAAC